VRSFELGLLWPHFMKFAGPIIGVGFGLEGSAFLTEAIFLSLYIYGWDRIPGVLLLRDRANPFHRRALAVGATVPLSGHDSAQVVART